MAIVDASVWVSAWIQDDVNRQAAVNWLKAHLGSGQPTQVPALALPEVAGAVARRTGVSEDGVDVVLAMMATPGFLLLEMDLARSKSAYRLAAEKRLRGSDAAYASIAQELAQPLVTLDAELASRLAGSITVVVPGSPSNE